jgi:hypothetical protein
METALVIIVILAFLAIAGAAIYYFERAKRTEQLRENFGPEYDRAVSQAGRGGGERDLRQREERISQFELHELEPGRRQEYTERWRAVQADFVDSPQTAIIAADDLVQEVMAAKGYPVADFEQRAADLSVQHSEVVSNYRQAHATSEAHRREPRSTEELRQAMIHYRALFADLLGEVPARP